MTHYTRALSIILALALSASACKNTPTTTPTPLPKETPQSTTTTKDPATEQKPDVAPAITLAMAAVHDSHRISNEFLATLPPPIVDPFDLLTTPKEQRGSKDLVIVAVGDVSQPTKQWVESTMKLKTKAFTPTQHLLDSGDLVSMNLENPVSELEPSARKKYAFTSHPERLGWYFDVGFNLFSLANNHIADADQAGIDDTLTHLKHNTEERNVEAWWAGAGASVEEAEQATIFTPPGKDLRIAFFSTGFSKGKNVSKFWSESLVKRIKEVDSKVDIVIVAVHAGKEYIHIPDANLKARYKSWVDAGADVVIGHHPHVIQPVEIYNDRPIFYSLGNYVFASRTVRHRKMKAKMYGLMPRIIIQDGKVTAVEITPTWVNNSGKWTLPSGESMPNSNFVPQLVTGPFADAFFEDFNAWTEETNATLPTRHEDTGRFTITPPKND